MFLRTCKMHFWQEVYLKIWKKVEILEIPQEKRYLAENVHLDTEKSILGVPANIFLLKAQIDFHFFGFFEKNYSKSSTGHVEIHFRIPVFA